MSVQSVGQLIYLIITLTIKKASTSYIQTIVCGLAELNKVKKTSIHKRAELWVGS